MVVFSNEVCSNFTAMSSRILLSFTYIVTCIFIEEFHICHKEIGVPDIKPKILKMKNRVQSCSGVNVVFL